MADKPHLSATQLTMYWRCPEQYRRRYLEGETIPPAIALIQGGAFHVGCETNFKQKVGTHEDLPASQIADVAVASFDDRLKGGSGRGDGRGVIASRPAFGRRSNVPLVGRRLLHFVRNDRFLGSERITATPATRDSQWSTCGGHFQFSRRQARQGPPDLALEPVMGHIGTVGSGGQEKTRRHREALPGQPGQVGALAAGDLDRGPRAIEGQDPRLCHVRSLSLDQGKDSQQQPTDEKGATQGKGPGVPVRRSRQGVQPEDDGKEWQEQE